MATNNPYGALYQAIEYQPKNFQRTRNVPIDTSFLLEKLSEIDEKIPVDIRYPGLIFFVKDAAINSGVTINGVPTIGTGPKVNSGAQRITGLLYVFEEDLYNPKPLHDLFTRFEIRCIRETNYTQLNYRLNNLYAKSGNIVLIDNIGITVICDYDGNWKYYSGTYIVENEGKFNQIPNNLKQPGVTVKILDTGANKIINSELQLTTEILYANTPEDCTEDRRFYNINGFIYYRFGGINIPVSDKFVVKANVKLNIGSNQIIHNFNSRYLSVYGIINENSESVNNDYKNICFPIEHKFITSNQISIDSSVVIESIDLCIVSKTHLTS